MILNYSALAVCYAALVLWNLLARRQSRTKSVAEAHDLV